MTTLNREAPITPAFPPKSEFRKWLRSLPADEVVANRWDCWSCPVALWLRASVGGIPRVQPATWAIWNFDGPTQQENRLPEWAEWFVERIDYAGRKKAAPGALFGPVTAADCLRVLSRTPRG